MKKQIIEKMSTLIISAFGLVAALAWNDAIKAIFERLFGAANGMWSMLIYAVAVTIIAVWTTVSIGKILDQKNQQE